jgi:outer membrane protein insertion porin family
LPVMSRDLEYYKVNYTATGYQPLTKYFVLDAHGYLGYGNGYDKMSGLPFFENYFAGGIGSVRGYSAQSLGPRDSNDDSLGGNVSIYGSLGLVIPSPMDSIRPTLFVDAGNVYNKQLNVGQLRCSAGIQVEWYTPFAPLVFSLAVPLHKQSGDNTEPFQFQIGLSF